MKEEILKGLEQYNAAFTAASKAIISCLNTLNYAGVEPVIKGRARIEEEDYWAPTRLHIDSINGDSYNYHPYVGLKRVNGDKDLVNLVTLKAACDCAAEILDELTAQIKNLKVQVEIPEIIKKLMK